MSKHRPNEEMKTVAEKVKKKTIIDGLSIESHQVRLWISREAVMDMLCGNIGIERKTMGVDIRVVPHVIEVDDK